MFQRSLRKLPLFAAVMLVLPMVAQSGAVHSGSHPPRTSSLQHISNSRAADSYAIYALLLPGAPLDKIAPTHSLQWALADTTVNLTDMNPAVPPDGLLKAPEDNPKAFQEAMDDFEVRKFERYALEAAGFHPPIGLRLMDLQEVRDIRESASGDRGVAFFSAVYFNRKQTAALVYVNDWCANLCSAGEWVYLEKHGTRWVRRSEIVRGGE